MTMMNIEGSMTTWPTYSGILKLLLLKLLMGLVVGVFVLVS